MERLSDLREATDNDRRWLQKELLRLPNTRCLDIGECDLPAGCTPARAAISFFRQSPFIAMRLDREISYTGSNRAMSKLSYGEPVYFQNFVEMLAFFKELPTEAAPTPYGGKQNLRHRHYRGHAGNKRPAPESPDPADPRDYSAGA